MSFFTILSLVFTATGLFSYLNYRFFKLPATIGVMAISMLFSLFLVFLHFFGLNIDTHALKILKYLKFSTTLTDGMLSFLLFAGSLHVNLKDLKREKWVVLVLSTITTALSTFFIGLAMYFVFHCLKLPIPFLFCLLFGSLISPTDPIAVMDMLKKTNAPKNLKVAIEGESLFNDGIAIVLFSTIVEQIDQHFFTFSGVLFEFLKVMGGGVLLGLAIGWAAYFLMHTVRDFFVLILITISVVTGGYSLALYLHLSGPITMVVAGVVIGNYALDRAVSDKAQEYLGMFWEVIDEVLNSVLFVIIGLEILVVKFTPNYIYSGLLAILVVLASRWLSILIPVSIFKVFRTFAKNITWIFTWGGLRGGVSIALALSAPLAYREPILTVTYIVMAFSILVQGITMQKTVIPKL